LSEQNSKYLERPSNRSDRPGKMQENQWPRNPVLTFWQSKRICSDNANERHSTKGACNTANPPPNMNKQMSQILRSLKPQPVPIYLTTDMAGLPLLIPIGTST
jgi:hypothetical protein